MKSMFNLSGAGVGRPDGNLRWTIGGRRIYSVVVSRFGDEASDEHPRLSAVELVCSKRGQPVVEEKSVDTPWRDLFRYRAGWATVFADFSEMSLRLLRAIQLVVPRLAPARKNRARPYPASAPFLFSL